MSADDDEMLDTLSHFDLVLADFVSLYEDLGAKCSALEAEKAVLSGQLNRRAHRVVARLLRAVGR